MLHKLRMAMGKRDEQYKLSGIIEIDEGFFTTEIDENEKKKPLKRGRGSQKKSKVLVMAESAPEEGKGGHHKGKTRKVGHIKMFVIEDLKSVTIENTVSKYIEETSTIDSDNSTS